MSFTKDDENANNVMLAKKFAEATDKVKAQAEEINGRMEKGEKLSRPPNRKPTRLW